MRIRDLAVRVGVTERAIQRMVMELREAGVLTVNKQGRRNLYAINLDAPLRHEVERGVTVGELLRFLIAT